MMTASMDSDGQFNLCNQRLLMGLEYVSPVKPMRLMATNRSVVPGESTTLEVELSLNGRTGDDKSQQSVLHVPTTVYGADITENLILECSWMVEYHVLINPREHAIVLRDAKALV